MQIKVGGLGKIKLRIVQKIYNFTNLLLHLLEKFVSEKVETNRVDPVKSLKRKTI